MKNRNNLIQFGIVAKDAPTGKNWELVNDPNGFLACSRCGESDLDRLMLSICLWSPKTKTKTKQMSLPNEFANQICRNCTFIALQFLAERDKKLKRLTYGQTKRQIGHVIIDDPMCPPRKRDKQGKYTITHSGEVDISESEIDAGTQSVANIMNMALKVMPISELEKESGTLEIPGFVRPNLPKQDDFK